jgi:hypothetical protein
VHDAATDGPGGRGTVGVDPEAARGPGVVVVGELVVPDRAVVETRGAVLEVDAAAEDRPVPRDVEARERRRGSDAVDAAALRERTAARARAAPEREPCKDARRTLAGDEARDAAVAAGVDDRARRPVPADDADRLAEEVEVLG